MDDRGELGETTRRRIIDAAYDLFYRCGFARAGVDAIAEQAGVTKRTLYHHFDSKDALLAAVLESQHALVLERMRAWATPADDAASLVSSVFVELERWAAKPGWQGSGFSRAALELADLPGHPARRAAHRHKAAVEDLFREQLAQHGLGEPGLVARQLMMLVEGCMILVLVHGDPSYAAAAADAARELVGARARG